MTIILRPLTRENWEEAAGLAVAEDQAAFITPNVWSIAASRFYEALQPMAIYDGATMVGFLMFGRDVNDGKLWLYRFMIDRRYQGRGFGRAALARLIELIRQTTEWTEINVGYDPANAVAERLYLGAGFARASVAPWGEQTARLSLTSRAMPGR